MTQEAAGNEAIVGRDATALTPVPPSRPRRSRVRRWFLWTLAIVLVIAAGVAITADVLLHRAAPMLRASLISHLQQRFHSKVELDDLKVSVLDGFWVEGRGLRIWLPGADNPDTAGTEPWLTQPWIVVDKMKFHAAWRILPGKPIDISVIHVEGARIQLPPKEDRPQFNKSSTDPRVSSGQPVEGTKSSFFTMPRIVIHQVECQQAHLIIEHRQQPGKPAKLPLDFELKQIKIVPDGSGGPASFSVDMINAKPIGTIHSTGHVGPIASTTPFDPGDFPVDGDYGFTNADLGTIKGIAGILSSTGHYTGTLRRIEVDGQTQTPDFRLDRVRKGTGLPLNTRFHAIVDGTNGNTHLDPVDATLGRTHFIATGDVLRAQDAPNAKPGDHGHDITLDVTMDKGYIDDILAIAADAEAPFMTGSLTLHTKFHLPPSPVDKQLPVFERLQLDGQFRLSKARFNNNTMQGRIAELSLRGEGKPDEVKTTNPETIFSEVQGHFKLSGGSLQLPDLAYQVPGATILAHGAYGLQGGTLAFEGDAKLDAELSNVVGGWKGFLLKPMDHYLKKNGAGTDVPIHVQGDRHHPKFGVDFDRLGKTDHTDAQ
jgi:hypothetical protein